MRKFIYTYTYVLLIIVIISFIYKLIPISSPLSYVEIPIIGERDSYSVEPRINTIGVIFTITYFVLLFLYYKYWLFKNNLKPLTEGIFLSLSINLTIFVMFMFSLDWDLDNLIIENFNSLILGIGIWQWIYILPINIILAKKYKKDIIKGVSVFSGFLTFANIALIIWFFIVISSHGLFGGW